MKGSKFLAVIALIALTGFLGIACSSGGGTSDGGDEEEDFISQYKERDRDTALIPSFRLDRDVAVVVDTDYNMDTLHFTATNFVPTIFTSIVSPAGRVTVVRAGNEIRITYGTTGTGTIKFSATDASGLTFTKDITVYSLDQNDLDNANLTLVSPIPNITYYTTDDITPTGVWKDINVKVTSNAFPGSYITVPLTGCTLADPFALAAADLPTLATSYGPYDVTFATATKRLIPALTIKEDVVNELVITGLTGLESNYRQAFDTAIDWNALTSFDAYWLNPRHPGTDPERSGKFRGKEHIGGWTDFLGLITDVNTPVAGTYGDIGIFFDDGAAVPAPASIQDPLVLPALPAGNYVLAFQYEGSPKVTKPINYYTVKANSLVVTPAAAVSMDPAEFEDAFDHQSGTPIATRQGFLWAYLKAVRTDVGVTVQYEGPVGTDYGTPADVMSLITFTENITVTGNVAAGAVGDEVADGDDMTITIDSIAALAAKVDVLSGAIGTGDCIVVTFDDP